MAGIKLLDLIPELDEDNYIDIGRALFDVGSYKKSKEFFDKFIARINCFAKLKHGHSNLDGLCKISILKSEDLHTNTLLGVLAYNPNDLKIGNIDISSSIPDHIYFRWFMFSVCHLIQTNQETEAFKKLKLLVACHKNKIKPQKQVCFREVFFLASQWKARGRYKTALTQYRVIKMLHQQLNDVPELFLHDYNDVDLSNEIRECLKNGNFEENQLDEECEFVED